MIARGRMQALSDGWRAQEVCQVARPFGRLPEATPIGTFSRRRRLISLGSAVFPVVPFPELVPAVMTTRWESSRPASAEPGGVDTMGCRWSLGRRRGGEGHDGKPGSGPSISGGRGSVPFAVRGHRPRRRPMGAATLAQGEPPVAARTRGSAGPRRSVGLALGGGPAPAGPAVAGGGQKPPATPSLGDGGRAGGGGGRRGRSAGRRAPVAQPATPDVGGRPRRFAGHRPVEDDRDPPLCRKPTVGSKSSCGPRPTSTSRRLGCSRAVRASSSTDCWRTPSASWRPYRPVTGASDLDRAS